MGSVEEIQQVRHGPGRISITGTGLGCWGSTERAQRGSAEFRVLLQTATFHRVFLRLDAV
jgi:hypothetical protein